MSGNVLPGPETQAPPSRLPRWRGRLVLRIFASFWVTMVAVFLATAWSTTELYRRANGSEIAARVQSDTLALQAAATLVYQHRGVQGLRLWMEQLNQDGKRWRHLYAFDQSDQELTGQPVPEVVREALGRGSSPDKRVYVSRANEMIGDGVTLVVQAGAPNPFRFLALQPWSSIGLLLGVVVSGLLCLLLARSITRPIERLRVASRGITAGRLDTRVGPEFHWRSDEIGDLGRDFDVMAERLQALLDAQRRLLRDVSHELRSPLARLRVALELARDDRTREDSSLDRIEREADRMSELILNILTWSRLESGITEGAWTELRPRDVIASIAADARYESGQPAAELELELDSDRSILAAPGLLRSAIENVLRNALRYAGDAGRVTVSLKDAEDGGVVVSVRDRGPGLPPDRLDDVFRPFVRLDAARDPGAGGHGLGLAIVERAVTAHGGRIEARNAEGGGLQVTLHLPAQPPLAA